jgi:hypothetical protein
MLKEFSEESSPEVQLSVIIWPTCRSKRPTLPPEFSEAPAYPKRYSISVYIALARKSGQFNT